MNCYTCGQHVPIDGRVTIMVGAMEIVGRQRREIPASPPLAAFLSFERHDHRVRSRSWDMEDIEEHTSANGQADVHFCRVDCVEKLFSTIVSTLRGRTS